MLSVQMLIFRNSISLNYFYLTIRFIAFQPLFGTGTLFRSVIVVIMCEWLLRVMVRMPSGRKETNTFWQLPGNQLKWFKCLKNLPRNCRIACDSAKMRCMYAVHIQYSTLATVRFLKR